MIKSHSRERKFEMVKPHLRTIFIVITLIVLMLSSAVNSASLMTLQTLNNYDHCIDMPAHQTSNPSNCQHCHQDINSDMDICCVMVCANFFADISSYNTHLSRLSQRANIQLIPVIATISSPGSLYRPPIV